jgi:hypothetical protein
VGGPKPRERKDLVKLLAEQRAALAASCESFDKGNEWEAPRLATALFTLVHDGGGIRSLLTQLGLRASLRFRSSGRIDPNPLIVGSTPPLIMINLGGSNTPRFHPKFDDPYNQKDIQFETWWKKELIFRDQGPNGPSLTRQRLIFSMRHQDGGGHVGALTDPAYVKLKAGGGWFSGRNKESAKPLDMAAAVTMRQIAWEATETFKQIGEIS